MNCQTPNCHRIFSTKYKGDYLCWLCFLETRTMEFDLKKSKKEDTENGKYKNRC